MSESKEKRGWWGQGEPAPGRRIPDVVARKRGLLPEEKPDKPEPKEDSESLASEEEQAEGGGGLGT